MNHLIRFLHERIGNGLPSVTVILKEGLFVIVKIHFDPKSDTLCCLKLNGYR